MTRYEYQFGVYVDAENEQEAWEKVRKVSEMLDGIDAEHESATELVGVEQGGLRCDSPKQGT